MENGNQPINAIRSLAETDVNGLTKREYFAAVAMQGCLAGIIQNYGLPIVNQASMEDSLKREQQFIDDVAIKSVRYSEALLKALELKSE